MQTENFLLGAKKLEKENVIYRILIPIMAISILVLSFVITNQDKIVVLTPPTINEKLTISLNKGSSAFKMGWAKYVASTIGNVDADNVDFSISSIQDMMAINLKTQFKVMMKEQVMVIKAKKLQIGFAVSSVSYNPKTNITYVIGKRSIRNKKSSKVVSEIVTYEFNIGVSNYMPVIKDFKLYEGKPKQRKK